MQPTLHSSDRSDSNVDTLKKSISDRLIYTVGKHPSVAKPRDWLQAAALAVRDGLVARWMKTAKHQYEQDVKRVYYLSMEFLVGRTFTNALMAVGLYDDMRQALAELGIDQDELAELEPDAALGNGGLGRLAACFLDSMATLAIPGYGYGIRYEYGMFRQNIVDGNQVETPDYWLATGNPWEFPRPEVHYLVRFGGRTEHRDGKAYWVDTRQIRAMAYDTIIPGYGTDATNTLRLWSAKATDEIDLSAFNQGNYPRAVESKNESENVSRLLYPDDSTPSGRALRLKQEYFFVSATLQDLLRRYLLAHTGFDELPDKVAIHLNDTHPVLAIPEMMRLLIDEHDVPWERAWGLVQRIFSYTNHTLMREALETWEVGMLARELPRHLELIYDINAVFLADATARFGDDVDLKRRLSLVDEFGERRVRMAYLAVVASHTVNGVSKLHSDLMTQSTFADLARLYPERFTNKTNGITPRRWLAQANRPLSALIDARIGPNWRRDLNQIEQLKQYVGDPAFEAEFRAAKLLNKQRLATWVEHKMQVTIRPDALFDVQVKRIHEYKRQLLNVLHVVTRYHRILAEPQRDWVPRVVIFGGKAASAYQMAKRTIKLINDVAQVINHDPVVGDRLKVLFLPNYDVSLAERVIPAADLSEQISTAGTEASGTGNMKLALNGALTIGTLDGANVEILEKVGAENIFIFGHTAEEVDQIRAGGYLPRQYYEQNAELRQALDAIRDGHFSPDAPHRFHDVFETLVNWGDHYLILADYASYVAAHDRVDARFRDADGWNRSAILNVAGMGMFSSDRTIAEYAQQVWKTQPIQI